LHQTKQIDKATKKRRKNFFPAQVKRGEPQRTSAINVNMYDSRATFNDTGTHTGFNDVPKWDVRGLWVLSMI